VLATITGQTVSIQVILAVRPEHGEMVGAIKTRLKARLAVTHATVDAEYGDSDQLAGIIVNELQTLSTHHLCHR
jgi:hypothetical protein